MPSGAGPGGFVVLGLVGRKLEGAVGDASAPGFGRVALNTTATAARAVNASPMTHRRPAARGLRGVEMAVEFFFGPGFLLIEARAALAKPLAVKVIPFSR